RALLVAVAAASSAGTGGRTRRGPCCGRRCAASAPGDSECALHALGRPVEAAVVGEVVFRFGSDDDHRALASFDHLVDLLVSADADHSSFPLRGNLGCWE